MNEFLEKRLISKTTSTILLAGGALMITLIGLLVGPIPQPPAYNHFADQRSWLGIAHAADVLSNIPIALAGLWGLFLLFTLGKVHFKDKLERLPWLGVSIGLFLTALGSSYYHLEPDNFRLVWDRVPLSIVFTSYVAALICERINIFVGLYLWPALLVIGFISVWQWYLSELHQASDLRLYLGVQTFALLATLIMLLTPSPYDRKGDIGIVIVFFGLARLFELYDHQIYIFSEGIFSGHTLKHIAAAVAGIWLIRMLAKRKILRRV